MVDELADVRHSLFFIRLALERFSKEPPEQKAISGCQLILKGLENQLRKLEITISDGPQG